MNLLRFLRDLVANLGKPEPPKVETQPVYVMSPQTTGNMSRAVYVMSIPSGETATLECSVCGPLGMIEKEQITTEQTAHRNYHREQWLAEQGTS